MKGVRTQLFLLLLTACTSCAGPDTAALPTGKANFNSNLIAKALDVEKGVIIQNSLPKGGPYTSPTGERFGHILFWTRVANATATPLEIAVNFPADSFAIFPSPTSYLKVFLPPGEMTLDKVPLHNYGLTGFDSFIDAGLTKPTKLQKTIPSGGEYLFYIGLLYKSTATIPSRAGLVLKGRNLFYKIITAKSVDSTFIPCGHILFKKGNAWSSYGPYETTN